MPSAKPEIAIRISDGNVESAVQSVRFASPDGEARFVEFARQAEKLNVRLTPPDQDVEGHEASPTTVLANIGLDEDDTVGHAISIHFPDAEAARRFRNQLLAAGAVTATLALGAGAGMALAPGVQVESGSASQAGSIDTSAQIREGGALSSASQGSATDTAAQIREGGSADEEEESITRGGLNPNP
jgi:hypothetical protein